MLTPRIVTFADLQRVLLPYCLGWSWAADAIRDLWLKGAPVPTGPHEPEKRILLPGQFKKWWAEVQQRQGLPVDPDAAYQMLTGRMSTSNGRPH